ncbi:hypothetical protein J2045_003426 [Peteryoungia aggregata LMG 23059]|uniref:Uncharacterized protein n=1 Tax=Peteryoungia aggregata LMG 23059 TaxID=1368425 RepID=A0ABU0GB95_9HYPH|nr:hypothetical protein [Peteryoungia aggregata]MDQ0422378.1 hypothetical protein [Peteryoungia aggregata LMG 23059]
MTTRFDNLPTDELVELERQARDDRKLLMRLIQQRFEAECGREIGRIYRIHSGRYAGRRMLLQYIALGGGIPMIHTQEPVYPVAQGPLDKRGGFNNRHQETRLSNLALEPEP